MKTLFLIAAVVLCGCEFHAKVESSPAITPSVSPVVHAEPPQGCIVVCSDDGHYSVEIDGEHYFVYDAVFTNRQGAIDRAWRAYTNGTTARHDANTQPTSDPMINGYLNHDWHPCDK